MEIPFKGGRTVKNWLLVTTALCSLTSYASAAEAPAPNALPQNGQVVAGSAGISASGSAMTVNQSTNAAIINWGSFDVGSKASVTFNQPDAGSRTLNRVLSSDPSRIYGSVRANGQLFFVNQNGVIIGNGARIEAGAVVASTLDTSNEEFMAGANSFTRGAASGEIVNEGTIAAAPKGYVALIGAKVTNKGTLNASQGQVAMAAGERVTLPVTGSGLIGIELDPATVQAAITNEGTITATDGQVYIKAEAAGDLGAQIVNKGTIEAQKASFESKSGSLTTTGTSAIHAGQLTARAQEMQVAGTINAAAQDARIGLYADVLDITGEIKAQNTDGTGGHIEASGTQETNLRNAHLDASGETGDGGTILIGGDWQGGGKLQRSAKTSVDAASTIKANAKKAGTGGKVVVWSEGKTDFAGRVEATSAKGDGGKAEVSGKVWLSYEGFADMRGANGGKTGTLLLDPTDFIVAASGGTITGATLVALLADANIELRSIDGTSGTEGSIYINQALTWDAATTLTLTAVANIYINAALTASQGELVLTTGGVTYNSYVNANVQVNKLTSTYDTLLTKAEVATIKLGGSSPSLTIAGSAYTLIGSVAEWNAMGLTGNYALNADIGTVTTIKGTSSSSYFAGKMNGLGHTVSVNIVGAAEGVGLFGYASNGQIKNIGVTGSVTNGAFAYTGGLVGFSGSSVILNVWSKADVSSSGNSLGGLIGFGGSVSITHAYATGIVSGTNKDVGGLGNCSSCTVSDSYATGAVTGGSNVGGLLGAGGGNTILRSYARGSVHGTGDNVGGLVGSSPGGSITDSYATGDVTGGGDYTGGLMGSGGGTEISSSYATGDVRGAGDYVGGLSGMSTGVDGVTSSYATGDVIGEGDYIGGLIGWGTSDILSAYATGSVNGKGRYVGGLMGYASGVLTSSYATGAVSGEGDRVGGLVGESSASITTSYATGSVSGQGNYVGGLVGWGTNSIASSYAVGAVDGQGNYVGGLAGYFSSSITSSYAIGRVNGGGAYIGGLIGDNGGYPSSTSSYWDMQRSGQSTSAGGTGLTTAEMKSGLPAGFDPAVWAIVDGSSYPYLLWQGAPLPIDPPAPSPAPQDGGADMLNISNEWFSYTFVKGSGYAADLFDYGMQPLVLEDGFGQPLWILRTRASGEGWERQASLKAARI